MLGHHMRRGATAINAPIAIVLMYVLRLGSFIFGRQIGSDPARNCRGHEAPRNKQCNQACSHSCTRQCYGIHQEELRTKRNFLHCLISSPHSCVAVLERSHCDYEHGHAECRKRRYVLNDHRLAFFCIVLHRCQGARGSI